MFETSTNFSRGLSDAYKQLEAEGKLTDQDKRVIGGVIERPVMFDPDGLPILAMKRLHLAVRRLYAKSHGLVAVVGWIDWTKVVDWLKENWMTIVKLALMILPFLI